jgi:hypothetical protein
MAEILPPPPVGEPFASYQWDDWYRKVRKTINDGQTVAWASITGKPSLVETSRTISTTPPLTGGGDLSSNRTLAVNDFSPFSKGVVPASTGLSTDYLAADNTWTDPLDRSVAVTGSRGGNAALASLLTALASLGLITDGTT